MGHRAVLGQGNAQWASQPQGLPTWCPPPLPGGLLGLPPPGRLDMVCEPLGHCTVLCFLVSFTHSQFSKFLRHWCLRQKNRTYLCSQYGSRSGSVPHLKCCSGLWHPDGGRGSLKPTPPVGGRGAPCSPSAPRCRCFPATFTLLHQKPFLCLLPLKAVAQPAPQGCVPCRAACPTCLQPGLGGGSTHGRAPADPASFFVLRGSW